MGMSKNLTLRSLAIIDALSLHVLSLERRSVNFSRMKEWQLIDVTYSTLLSTSKEERLSSRSYSDVDYTVRDLTLQKYCCNSTAC